LSRLPRLPVAAPSPRMHQRWDWCCGFRYVRVICRERRAPSGPRRSSRTLRYARQAPVLHPTMNRHFRPPIRILCPSHVFLLSFFSFSRSGDSFSFDFGFVVPLVEIKIFAVNFHLAALEIRRFGANRCLGRKQLPPPIQVYDEPITVLVAAVEIRDARVAGFFHTV